MIWNGLFRVIFIKICIFIIETAFWERGHAEVAQQGASEIIVFTLSTSHNTLKTGYRNY